MHAARFCSSSHGPRPGAPADAVDAIRARYGLDRPLWERYLTYMFGVVQGDFGEARREVDAALALTPEMVEAILMLGSVLENTGNKSEAVDRYSDEFKRRFINFQKKIYLMHI